jgi:cyclopropane-fatty-acyl-phospholipid synthase
MNREAAFVRTAADTPWAARALLGILPGLRRGCLRLQLPDGQWQVFGDAHALPAAELRLHDWRACSRILAGGDIGFAEAWRRGWVDSPDLGALFRVVLRNDRVLDHALFGSSLLRWWYRLQHGAHANTRAGSRRNIHAHYDIGNPFYALWLDRSWTYSSALFDGNPSQTLEAAQEAKYARIVARLGLKPGDRVLEIGCGWGGFAEHAARRGIAVHGVTLSEAQLAFGTERLQRLGLAHLARLELRDYRDLGGDPHADGGARYDAIVSIEMFEAVGERYWPQYFAALRRCLSPGGRALVQTITIDERHYARYRAGSDFIQQYVFPGGMLPSMPRFCAAAARGGLAVEDAHAFGPDYAETLRRWSTAFEAKLDAVRGLGLDETFIRTWRMYFAYCEAGFDERRIDVVQFLLRA